MSIEEVKHLIEIKWAEKYIAHVITVSIDPSAQNILHISWTDALTLAEILTKLHEVLDSHNSTKPDAKPYRLFVEKNMGTSPSVIELMI